MTGGAEPCRGFVLLGDAAARIVEVVAAELRLRTCADRVVDRMPSQGERTAPLAKLIEAEVIETGTHALLKPTLAAATSDLAGNAREAVG